MIEPLNPTGFWSYTSSDDTASHGRLSQLRRLLAAELRLKVGGTPKVHIFQDVAAIPHASVTRMAPPYATAPMRSRRKMAAWGVVGAVALLLVTAFAFSQQRGPPGQTAQFAALQPVQPSAPTAARPEPATPTVGPAPPTAPPATHKPEPAATPSAPIVPPAATELAPGSVARDCPTCPELVLIPPGSFVMGVPPGEDDREGVPGYSDGDARPQHTVTITRAFWLGRYPVTRGGYAAFVQDTGYQGGRASWRDPAFPQTDRDPVVDVSATDATAYAAWLSRKTGKTYRLPSEAEWEYAARAGTATARFWGDGPAEACRYANVADKTMWARWFGGKYPAHSDKVRYFACDDGYANTSPVGNFQPNSFGLYDMLGNVWQWTADCWNDWYKRAPGDGSAWTTGDCAGRVLRGGSWLSAPGVVRAGYRHLSATGFRSFDVGFRLARTP